VFACAIISFSMSGSSALLSAAPIARVQKSAAQIGAVLFASRMAPSRA
jgi:hypothetical protein